MDVKETLKQVGQGMVIRRAASMMAHKKDYKGYVNGIKEFSSTEKKAMLQKAETIGERIGKGAKRG